MVKILRQNSQIRSRGLICQYSPRIFRCLALLNVQNFGSQNRQAFPKWLVITTRPPHLNRVKFSQGILTEVQPQTLHHFSFPGGLFG